MSWTVYAIYDLEPQEILSGIEHAFFLYFATNFKFGQKIYFQFLTAQMNSPKSCNFSKNWYTLGHL